MAFTNEQQNAPGSDVPEAFCLLGVSAYRPCNSDDRRQWRKQGEAVGAAASGMQAKAKQTLGAATRFWRVSA